MHQSLGAFFAEYLTPAPILVDKKPTDFLSLILYNCVVRPVFIWIHFAVFDTNKFYT